MEIKPPPEWKRYQEEVAQFFRDLGLTAATDVTVKGVRTKHEVDVLVESSYKGVAIKWVVECKRWKNPVTKETILTLRTIVEDFGADRGFVMCEAGYQKGALESAYLTNIQLSSLQDLHETCEQELAMMRVRALYLRANELGDRYWVLDKDTRIEHGLRPDLLEVAYSGDSVVKACEDSLISALFHGFPVAYNEDTSKIRAIVRATFKSTESDVAFQNPTELADFVSAKLDELERLLEKAEAGKQVQSPVPVGQE